MAWTVLNQSTAAIPVSDIPVPQTVQAGATADFEIADVLSSRTLAENIGGGALVVVACGDYAPFDRMAPVQYEVHASGTETQTGTSDYVTTAGYTSGQVLLNITALGVGTTLTITFEPFDGTTTYPDQSVIAVQSATGPVFQAFAPIGIAGRFKWTLGGTNPSATFSLLYVVS